MTTPLDTATAFFAGYAQALLDRDAQRLSSLYAVPALILFPQKPIPVTDAAQTAAFFDQGWEQYDGVEEAEFAVDIVASTGHSIWADVTWTYGGRPRERFIYQLVNDEGSWQVAVLTPLGPDD